MILNRGKTVVSSMGWPDGSTLLLPYMCLSSNGSQRIVVYSMAGWTISVCQVRAYVHNSFDS